MIALRLVSAECGAVPIGGAASGTCRNGGKRWAVRRENVKDRQNRQCLFCGRYSSRRLNLEIHHVKKIEHGGTDALLNLVAVCHACHRFVHNVEREMPFMSRLILILQIIRPESLLIAWVSRLLFARFLRSAGATTFHPAALALRPAGANCAAVLACLFAAAVAAFAQVPPSPDTIRVVQEREAHERAVAERIAYQVAKQPPKAVAEPEAPRRHLSPTETRELMEALDRYFRENARVPVFWTPGARL